MFVIKASTPEAMRDEIVKWLNIQASNHRIAASKINGMHKKAKEETRATTYENAAKFLEGCTVEVPTDLLFEAREIIKPFAAYEASNVFRIVHENAPENLYVMRNSDGDNITQLTVKDFRAATAFLTKS